MLTRFEVENYRGFKDRLVLDLTSVRNYTFNSQCVDGGVVSKALLVGRNGCGKTNLGLALFDIVGTLTDKGLDIQMKDPSCFINGDGELPYATFVYCFRDDGGKGIRFEYRKANPETIVYERLDLDGCLIYERNGNDSDYSGLALFNAKDLRMDLGDGKLSVLRYVANNTIQASGSPISFVMDFASKMLYFRSVQDENSYAGLVKGSEIIDNFIMENGLVEDFQKFIHDMAKIDIKLERRMIEGMPDMLVQITRNRAFPFSKVASSGTKALMLVYYWMRHFKDVKFLYMDEFDAYYHYELAEDVLLNVRDIGGIQAIMTSHNTALMSNGIFRPDCYYLMDGGRIESFADRTPREIRFGHNLEKMYRNGEFDE